MFYNTLKTNVCNEIYCCIYMQILQYVYLYKSHNKTYGILYETNLLENIYISIIAA